MDTLMKSRRNFFKRMALILAAGWAGCKTFVAQPRAWTTETGQRWTTDKNEPWTLS